MSWISNPQGRPDRNFRDDGPKVPDPAIPDRMVSTKRANQPFLAYVFVLSSPILLYYFFFFFSFRYKAYRDEQAKLHAAWREREEARLAAIARGDPNPPPAEPDPTAEREIGLLGLLKFFFYVLLVALLAGKFVTGEWAWGMGDSVGRVVDVRRWWPPLAQGRLFSERLLAQFDGSDAEKPIYLAVRFLKAVRSSYIFFFFES
jgi:hypothetical protein